MLVFWSNLNFSKNDSQKAYLAVSSAAEFIINDIQQAEYDEVEDSDEKEFISESPVFQELLETAITYIDGSFGPYNTTFTVDAGEHFDDVLVKFRMQKNYKIIMDLSLGSHTIVGGDTDYNLTVKMTYSGGKWHKSSIDKGRGINE